MRERYGLAVLLQFLAPVLWSFGLWLLFPNLQISGSACLTCLPTAEIIVTSIGALVQTIVGLALFPAGLMLFVSSLGIFASVNNTRAGRWLLWPGRWRPKWPEQSQELSVPPNYRKLVLASLALGLFFAILVIPGIGEDRQFLLNQFYDLWGTLWYFYVFLIGIVGWILVYKKRTGGYYLSLILCLVSIGTVVPDLLGFLPPSSPTLRTSILFASQMPVSVLCAFASSRAIRFIST